MTQIQGFVLVTLFTRILRKKPGILGRTYLSCRALISACSCK